MHPVSKCLLVSTLLLLSGAARAELYRWVDENGRVQYSDKYPGTTNSGTAVLNKQGAVIRKTDGYLTPEQRQQKEVEASQQRAAQQKKQEATLHDKALVSSFNSTADIDRKRDRDLQPVQGDITALRASIKSAKVRADAYVRQSDQFKKSKKPVPQDLQQDIQDSQKELQNLNQLLAQKMKDEARIRQAAEDDKKRFLELTQLKSGS